MMKKVFLGSLLTLFLSVTVQNVAAAGTVQDCEKRMPASLKGRLCEIRQYKIIDGPDMEKHMECVLRAVDFVDAKGAGDYHKLYKPLNAIEKDRKHDFNLENCGGNTFRLPTAGQRSNEFYKCMLKSTSADAFKKVFDLTELIKAGKLPEGSRYDNKVANMMKKIDKKICK